MIWSHQVTQDEYGIRIETATHATILLFVVDCSEAKKKRLAEAIKDVIADVDVMKIDREKE